MGTVSCNGDVTPKYDLTMAEDPAAGGTATDETNESPYAEDTDVRIKAVANAGYQFVNWSAPAGEFADENAEETTFTMPAQHVTVTANFAEEFAGGNGTEEDPYQIANWHHLHSVRNYLDSYFILVNSLNSTTAGYTERASPTANDGKGWQPIETSGHPFTGTFDGQGYEISDLFIDRPDENRVGLFGDVDEGGIIKNVGVVNADVTGHSYVGGLVAKNNDGTVSNSYSTGNVTGYTAAGGLAGMNQGTVSNSYSTGNVTGYTAVGGLVGWNRGTVEENSYSTGNVSGEEDVGGLLGRNDGTVSDSYSTGNVTGSYCVGGLVGWNSAHGTVINSHFTGSASGYPGYPFVGGLAGDNHDGTVEESYATGNVTGYVAVGGLVGRNYYATVSNSYSTGNVTGYDVAVGGLVGWNYEDTVSNSFWDIETSGQATSDGGTGKNTTEMKNIRTFKDPDWSEGLEDTWNIIEVADETQRNTAYIWNMVDTVTYPFLSWQPVS